MTQQCVLKEANDGFLLKTQRETCWKHCIQDSVWKVTLITSPHTNNIWFIFIFSKFSNILFFLFFLFFQPCLRACRTGSHFPNQRLKPGHGNESPESQPPGQQGTPQVIFLKPPFCWPITLHPISFHHANNCNDDTGNSWSLWSAHCASGMARVPCMYTCNPPLLYLFTPPPWSKPPLSIAWDSTAAS